MGITINVSELDKIIDYFKMVKCTYVALCQGVALGFDERLCMIKAVQCDDYVANLNLAFCVQLQTLVDFRKRLLPIDTVEFNYSGISSALEVIPYANKNIITVYEKYIYMNAMCNNDIHLGSVKEMYELQDFLSAKAADGAVTVRLDERHIMCIPSNILSVNKSDDLTLDISDGDGFFLSRFTVIKKKKFYVETYMRFLSL